MKNNILLMLAAASCFSAVANEGAVPVAQSAARQWTGYTAQIATTAGVHVVGNAITNRLHNSIPLYMAVAIGKYIVAKSVQHTISNNVFKFTNADWASSSNNWAHVCGLITGSTITYNLPSHKFAPELLPPLLLHMFAQELYESL